ncbi:beta-lactamase [Burkholderia sp. FERM BP-3421]|uniref:class C beta-lactamase n=1 Tax=Burkholderia sp. FERM BP-3421 TaxID=1494466 RepID=UPI00236297CD|nr:class C beta-lactamase [Burkholderia sp. FERM BP-3421]WDD95336.1 beta-lactamase [Burkholderia sp. FERM BP-3421]
MKFNTRSLMMAAAFSLSAVATSSHAADNAQDTLGRVVSEAIRPVMAKYDVAGMAVGVIVDGEPHVFNFGVASTATHAPVTRDTLFELGSVSKTLTATLASYAQASGKLSLSDPTRRYLPAMQGTRFGDVKLLNLGTHTPGGFPLQVPERIGTDDQLMQYFKEWRPAYTAGTYRTYANPSIGMLGVITAKSMGRDFTALMEQWLFPALGMNNTFINVPAAQMGRYAQGYTKEGAPIRVAPGMLSAEAYGVKSSVADMLRFVQANMALVHLDGKLQQAITDTHTGYFQAGPMTQDLIWEQYPYPTKLDALLEGNSARMAFEATPVVALNPPHKPRQDVWINKTGGTNGFGSYVAFVPEKQLGIVILANKNIPNDERIKATYRIFSALADAAR